MEIGEYITIILPDSKIILRLNEFKEDTTQCWGNYIILNCSYGVQNGWIQNKETIQHTQDEQYYHYGKLNLDHLINIIGNYKWNNKETNEFIKQCLIDINSYS